MAYGMPGSEAEDILDTAISSMNNIFEENFYESYGMPTSTFLRRRGYHDTYLDSLLTAEKHYLTWFELTQRDCYADFLAHVTEALGQDEAIYDFSTVEDHYSNYAVLDFETPQSFAHLVLEDVVAQVGEYTMWETLEIVKVTVHSDSHYQEVCEREEADSRVIVTSDYEEEEDDTVLEGVK